MDNKINSIVESFESELEKCNDAESFEQFRIKYLGRKGLVSNLFEEFKLLPKDEKPKYGQLLNITKNRLQNIFDQKITISGDEENSNLNNDLSLPARKIKLGHKHLISQTLEDIKSIFKSIGFSVFEGPELESDYYNFEALNFPPDHPARDMQDTFFINSNFVLRTHTSPVQIRLMETSKPPIRALMPGKVFRNEAISAKSYCLFHQVEGLFIDKNVSFAELKGTLIAFAKQYYGDDVKYRFRSSYFPFTEPSAEVDIWWQTPNKPGKWLEVLGCGMVDPNVLIKGGIDPEEYSGYAFGMGVERIAMLKYGISDIRHLFDNDNRFLNQF